MIEDCYMTGIIDKINSLYPISDDTIRTLKESMTLCRFPKKYQLIRAGMYCKSAYFIGKGMTRSFEFGFGACRFFCGGYPFCCRSELDGPGNYSVSSCLKILLAHDSCGCDYGKLRFFRHEFSDRGADDVFYCAE